MNANKLGNTLEGRLYKYIVKVKTVLLLLTQEDDDAEVTTQINSNTYSNLRIISNNKKGTVAGDKIANS